MSAKKAKPEVAAIVAPAQEAVVAFKGFDQNLRCRGYQYAIGQTFIHEGNVVRCAAGGFHSCESPLDVFAYYPPGDSRYAIVEASGKIDRDNEDSKIASGTITITGEIKIPQLVTRFVDWVMEKIDSSLTQSNTGDSSAATNNGYRSAATNTGDRSAATNTGDSSAATNTGDSSAATSAGHSSAATNTGDRSAATSTGDSSAATSTGYSSAAEVSGAQSVAIASGYAGRSRASAGSAIVLCYRNDDHELIHIRASKVGENGIKADAWYSLSVGGEFVEVQS